MTTALKPRNTTMLTFHRWHTCIRNHCARAQSTTYGGCEKPTNGHISVGDCHVSAVRFSAERLPH